MMSQERSAYGHVRLSHVMFAGQQVELALRPDIPGYDTISPAMRLLAEAIAPPSGARLLLLGIAPGAVGVCLGRAGLGEVVLHDPSLIGLELAQNMLGLNRAQGVYVREAIDLPDDEVGRFDLVAVEVAQSRALTRRWLVEAHRALCPGGVLYLVGANRLGVQPAIADAGALFGNVAPVASRERQRLARAERRAVSPPPPDWASTSGIAPGTRAEFLVERAGLSFSCGTLPGVFAADRLDDGTALLLDVMSVPSGGRVLDVGCGCGVIGAFAALRGAGAVDMTDVSLLAIAAARHTVALNRLAGIEVLAGDVLGAVSGRRYDLIVSNPPFHSGQATSHAVAAALIAQARNELAPGGRLVIVTNSFLPYERRLRETFPTVIRLAGDRRYEVWEGLIGA